MAPSKDTSYRVFTPVIPSTPVQIVSDLLMDVIQPWIGAERQQNTPSFPVYSAIPQLAATNLGYLVTNSPIKALSPLPDVLDIDISPVKGQMAKAKAKAKEPWVKTDYELKLEETLEIERARLLNAKGQAMQLQAAVILQQ
ncbi:hypothetical protein H0H81_010755, partial [Sphagnurus paluster]